MSVSKARLTLTEIKDSEKKRKTEEVKVITGEIDKIVAHHKAVCDENEANFELERNKFRFEKNALQQCIESISAEIEILKKEKKCLTADRNNLRKHYQDYVQMTRSDIIENQSGTLVTVHRVETLKSHHFC